MPDLLAPLGGSGQAQPLVPAPVPSPPSAATASVRPEEATSAQDSLTAVSFKAQGGDRSRAQSAVPLEEASKTFREFLKGLPADLQYSLDDETGTVVFKVVNPVTKEVIRQYPPEELLEVARRLTRLAKGEKRSGILLDRSL